MYKKIFQQNFFYFPKNIKKIKTSMITLMYALVSIYVCFSVSMSKLLQENGQQFYKYEFVVIAVG